MMSRINRITKALQQLRQDLGVRIFYRTNDGRYWDPSTVTDELRRSVDEGQAPEGAALYTSADLDAMGSQGWQVVAIAFDDLLPSRGGRMKDTAD